MRTTRSKWAGGAALCGALLVAQAAIARDVAAPGAAAPTGAVHRGLVVADASGPPPVADLDAIGLAAGMDARRASSAAPADRVVVLFRPVPGSALSTSAFVAYLDSDDCPVALTAGGQPADRTGAVRVLRGSLYRGSGRAHVELGAGERTPGKATGEARGEDAGAVERATRAALAQLGIRCRAGGQPR